MIQSTEFRPRRTITLAPWVPDRRTLHLVDIENLMGGPRAPLGTLRRAACAYRATIPPQDEDHVVVGCNPRLALRAQTAFPGARVVVGGGPDGADRALLRHAEAADLARRYERVSIGSGDGIFTTLVTRLRAHGVPVCIVSHPAALSRDLQAAARRCVRLSKRGDSHGTRELQEMSR